MRLPYPEVFESGYRIHRIQKYLNQVTVSTVSRSIFIRLPYPPYPEVFESGYRIHRIQKYLNQVTVSTVSKSI